MVKPILFKCSSTNYIKKMHKNSNREMSTIGILYNQEAKKITTMCFMECGEAAVKRNTLKPLF